MEKHNFFNTKQISEQTREKKKAFLLQDVGILIFLLSMMGAVAAITMTSQERIAESYVLFAVMCAGVILAAYKFRYMALTLAAIEVLFYTIYRVYIALTMNVPIDLPAYMWVFLPLTAVAGMVMFQSMYQKIETANEVLESQMEELILINQETGLYNRRALYVDLQRQMAYSRRNDLNITLLWIQLRYAQELEHILTPKQFLELKQRLAEALEEAVRIEDRVYAIDEKGTFAVILTCDYAGSLIVKNRINAMAHNKTLFADIAEKSLKVELKMAAGTFGEKDEMDAFAFTRKVENELQYDV